MNIYQLEIKIKLIAREVKTKSENKSVESEYYII